MKRIKKLVYSIELLILGTLSLLHQFGCRQGSASLPIMIQHGRFVGIVHLDRLLLVVLAINMTTRK